MTTIADLIRAPAGRAQEHLEMAQAGIRVAVERGVCRGAVLAMAMAEAHSNIDLSGIGGFPPS